MLTLPIFSEQMCSDKRVQCRQNHGDQVTAQELFALGSQDSLNYVSAFSPENSNLKPCIWHEAQHCCATGCQEAEVLTSCWDVCGTTAMCSIEAGSAGSHSCQSHPNKLSLHSHCLSAKTVSQH